jgi:antitoxin FitA
MVASWFHAKNTMPTTLTLKGIPDAVYERLKATALAHRRSLNNEAISVLEAALLPQRTSAADHLAKARALRAALKSGAFTAADIAAHKQQGRK